MDYSELFYTERQNIIDQEAKSLKNKLAEAREEDLNFIDVLNQVNNHYYNLVNKQKDKSTKEGMVHKVFIEGISKYRGELDNKIKNSIKKYLYKYYDDNATGFKSYRDVVSAVAKIEGLNSVQQTFSIENRFFEDMYELNDFKHFTLNITNYPYSDEYKKVHLRLYPEQIVEEHTSKNKDYSKEINETKIFLERFDDREKLIMLKAFHAYAKEKFDKRLSNRKLKFIPTTEFIKITLLISNFSEPDIFYKKAGQSKIYDKVKNLEINDEDHDVINNIMAKLKNHNVRDFIGFLSRYDF